MSAVLASFFNWWNFGTLPVSGFQNEKQRYGDKRRIADFRCASESRPRERRKQTFNAAASVA